MRPFYRSGAPSVVALLQACSVWVSQAYATVQPPSTTMVWPVKYCEASLAKIQGGAGDVIGLTDALECRALENHVEDFFIWVSADANLVSTSPGRWRLRALRRCQAPSRASWSL